MSTNEVRIGRQGAAGRRAVAEYILRSPFSQQKMQDRAMSRTVISRSKMHPVLKRNLEVFPVLDWLAALTAHIPNAGEHVVRYYGWYSNVSRGKRKKTQAGMSEGTRTEVVEVPPPAISPALKHRWAHFIRQVYEADPLVCPLCGGQMRIIAFIEQAEVIEKILTHLPACAEGRQGPVARQRA